MANDAAVFVVDCDLRSEILARLARRDGLGRLFYAPDAEVTKMPPAESQLHLVDSPPRSD